MSLTRPGSTTSPRAAGERFVQRILGWAVDRIRSNPRLYRLVNRNLFADLTRQEMMLADTRRVDAYAAALPRAVRPADSVLDLGTGTGILAFLAARATTGSVHAVEHGEIVEVARRLARDNDIHNVTFHRTHSARLQLSEPVDVLVHEQMGNYLLDERMVTNIADLRDRLLRPGAAIVPARFELFLSPVQLRDDYQVPMIWAQSVHGIRFDGLRGHVEDPVGHHRILHRPDAYARRLCDDARCLEVDLHTARPEDLPDHLTATQVAVRDGRVDGLAVWFRAHLDEDTTITTSPFAAKTSWMVPLLRLPGNSLEVSAGDLVTVELRARDLESVDTWTWDVSVRTPDRDDPLAANLARPATNGSGPRADHWV